MQIRFNKQIASNAPNIRRLNFDSSPKQYKLYDCHSHHLHFFILVYHKFDTMTEKVQYFESMNDLSNPGSTLPSEDLQEQPQQNESDIDLQTQMQDYSSLGQEYVPTEFFNSSKQQSFEMVLPNVDNDHILIDKYNSPSAGQISNINKLLSDKADFSSLWNLWNQSDYSKVIQGFQFNVQYENWKLLRYQCEKPLENLLNQLQLKIISTSHANQIYPGLVKLRNKIMARMQATINPIKMPQKDNEKKSDALYEYYLREIDSKNKRQGAFYIKDKDNDGRKIPLGEFVAKSEHAGSHAWKDIFFKATLLHNKPPKDVNVQEQQQEKTQRINKQLIKAEILKNASCVFPPDNHICCAQFFFFNHRIYDQVISSCPIITERSFSKFIQQEQEQNQTIKDIVGLMNSGGGVILFNAFMNYLEIQPKGEVILESQFQQAINFIQEGLRYIRPLVSFNEQVFVNFVPVARNLFSEGTVLEDTKNYIEGLYCMRIVVKPTDDAPEYLYYYSKGDEAKMFIVQKNIRKLIIPTQMHKIMKKRFNYYYIPEKDYADQEEKNMIKKTYSYFANHGECLAPEKGLPLKIKKVKKTDENTDKQLQTKYKYLTLLVTNTNNHQVIEQRLRAKGIECSIVMKYHKYRFRAANNSGALFHNVKFNKLLEEVAYKKEFEFDQRYMLTILVTPYIKFIEQSAPNESDCATLQNWLTREHPGQKLKVWKFSQEKDYEYYFQTDSKLSSLFIYFLLTHYNMKSTFKNPKGYDKMSEDERKNRFTLWYPRTSIQTNSQSEKKKHSGKK